MLRLIVLIFLLQIIFTEAFIIEKDKVWQMVSQYALGVWKNVNVTSILHTIPHT